MKTLLIINDPPYGTERLYNALRLAHALIKQEGDVTVFLLGDAVAGAKTGQKTPDGFYNSERMVKRVATKGRVLLCGTCMDARGITDEEIVEGAERSTMDALAEATGAADGLLNRPRPWREPAECRRQIPPPAFPAIRGNPSDGQVPLRTGHPMHPRP